MNRNDDLERLLEGWLRRQAPPEAPDRVLSAALERVDAEPQRRAWLHRMNGGSSMTQMTRAVALAAVIAVATIVGVQLGNRVGDIGSTPSPNPSVTPSHSEPGSASPGASASLTSSSSEPSPAGLVLRLLGGSEQGRVHLVTILDDGSVITTDPSSAEGPMVRRLTSDGLGLMRAEVAATGLSDRSADYQPVPNPGVEPPGYGGAGPSLEIGQEGADTVIVTWFLFGDTEEDYFQPQPEAEALDALATRLTTLDEWLPADAWVDAEAGPYAASSYRIVIGYQPWGGSPDELPAERDGVAWPLAGEMASFGEVLNPPPDEVRCGVVDASEAAMVIQALSSGGATRDPGAYQAFGLGERETNRLVTVTVEPILPFEDAGC